MGCYIIIIDWSNGDPIGISTFSGAGDFTIATLLDHIKSRPRIGLTTVSPPPEIYVLPPDKAPVYMHANSQDKLRRIRPDWRKVMSECASYLESTRVSKIRDDYDYTEDQFYLIAFCKVIKQPARLNPHTIHEETPHSHTSVAASIRAKIKDPSTSAKNEYLIETERPTRTDAVYNGRPADLTGPSIAIYHPIFARFQQALSQTPSFGGISRTELDAASSLIFLSAQYYATEADRQYAIAGVMRVLLGPLVTFKETTLRYGTIMIKPDGHRSVECGLFTSSKLGFYSMLNLIAELKNGIGLGDRDPIEQAEKGYVVVVTAPEFEKLRHRSCMPAFLLGISGPYITVSGAIYVDGVITERLTDLISLVPVLSVLAPLGHTSARDKLTYKIAHLFQCLRECLDQLAAEYLNMSLEDVFDPRVLLPRPHFSSFSIEEREYRLTYLHRLFPSRSERAVFFAEVQSTGQPATECVVKFTSAYCPTAHNIVHEAGAAPKLLYCRFEPTVGKFCVVTEYVNEPGPEQARLTEEGKKKLQDAVNALHSRSYVFGDLRDANILVDEHGHPNLIDFDWSGIEGEVFYPTDINMESIDWVKGVQPGGAITRNHDSAMLQKFFDNA